MTKPHSKVPFLSYDLIRRKASEFRERFTCTTKVCPIEKIIEFELNLYIVPVLGLWQKFGISGFLSSDLTTVTVDEYCYLNMEEKYRFTLAHETGHLELHADLYRELSFGSITEWHEAIGTQLSRQEYGWLEQQADMFAGLVLVSSEHLLEEFDNHASVVKDNMKKHGLVPTTDEYVFNASLKELSNRISSAFVVSPKVIETRLHYDSLKKEFRRMIMD